MFSAAPGIAPAPVLPKPTTPKPAPAPAPTRQPAQPTPTIKPDSPFRLPPHIDPKETEKPKA